MTKAFTYFRTSSATNVGPDKDSLARQEAAVASYAEAHNIQIVQSFYDAAVSGSDMIDARPGFQDMLTAIAGNGVRMVLVETANRFARDLIVQETGHKFLREQGIELVAVDSPQSFLDDTPTATLVRQILGAVAQFEKASLVAKLAAARKRTGHMGGRPKLSDARADMALRIRQMRAEDPETTLRAMAARLANEGYVTASGRSYGTEAVARILRRGA